MMGSTKLAPKASQRLDLIPSTITGAGLGLVLVGVLLLLITGSGPPI